MAEFTWTARLPFSADTVFRWYSRKGAFERLMRDSSARPVQSPTLGLRDGSESQFVLSPWWLPGPLGLTWASKHAGYAPGIGFTDVQTRGPFSFWANEHRIVPAPGGCDVVDSVTYTLPGGLDRIPAVRSSVNRALSAVYEGRSRRTLEDLTFHAEHPGRPGGLTVLITGASGLVGTRLAAFLSAGGHEVRTVSLRGVTSADDLPEGLLDGADAVVHLAGAPIGGRFTKAHKTRLRESRILGTRALVELILRRKAQGLGVPEVFVSASASGYYGTGADGGGSEGAGPARDADSIHAETDAPGKGFLADLCRDWEAEASRAAEAGVRVVRVRSGLALSAGGGIAAPQLPAAAVGIGARLAGGRAWQPWISVDDLVRIYAFAVLEPRVDGPINASAPQPVRQGEFAAVLAEEARLVPGLLKGFLPAVSLPVPRRAVTAAIGEEAARELVLSSARMGVERLESLGFTFLHPDLRSAVRAMIS